MNDRTINPYLSESRLLLLVGLVQFINVLDFMMVMPLGPDFAKVLDIPLNHIGYIGGAYTFAAAITGFIGSLFLDRFQRRQVILLSLFGLIIATVSAAFTNNLHQMIMARIAAGIFGGPLTAASLALIADLIPPQRRGDAMGKVMGAFAVASILGVPFGLEISGRFGWQAPFISFGIIGTLILSLIYNQLRIPSRVIVQQSVREQLHDMWQVVSSLTSLSAFGITAFAVLGGFMLIPNISAHLQMNIGYPREHLGLLYLVGGLVSFFGMRFAGKLADRITGFRAVTLFTIILLAVLFFGFVWWDHSIPIIVIFTFFMFSQSARNVCTQTLLSKVPPPALRGGFMSINTAITHLACAFGAIISSVILQDTGHHLAHVPEVAWLSMVLSCAVPPLFFYVEKRVATRSVSPFVKNNLTGAAYESV